MLQAVATLFFNYLALFYTNSIEGMYQNFERITQSHNTM